MVNNQTNKTNTQNRVRNRLVGLATLLLILAAIAPWILTDKSSSRTSTTPILKPDVVNQQNQVTPSADDSNNDFANNTNSLPDIPYIPNDEQNADSTISSDMADEVDTATQVSSTSQVEPDSKLYMIQLTALKNKQKIEELVALLRLNNYNVRIIPKNPEPNQLIKLQVGPYAKKGQAEQVIISLNNLTKLKGIIVAN
ncbi:SPOR domain-containing protein [Gilliamella sp. wkB112]|uniref:SPOR domain-containing protein n=1 Tax=Gilliamella sp. wkB112 TaxID=3120257 RepID=UPI00080E67BD|nr:SPOR domain-containing protein [Gilliamella apicola]OCG04697.1 hypothetical protein A9G12_06720 [Gilliamella apicola]